MADPKGEKPASDHPHEDDLSLELNLDQEGLPGGEEHLLDSTPVNASTEEFHFSGPVEDLDFTEPSDFAFPTEQPADIGGGPEEVAEAVPADAEQIPAAEEALTLESALPEEAVAFDAAQSGEEIAELEIAAEPAEGEERRRFPVPTWVVIADWIGVGVICAGILAALVSSLYMEKGAALFNFACFAMLAVIPFVLFVDAAHKNSRMYLALLGAQVCFQAANGCLSGEFIIVAGIGYIIAVGLLVYSLYEFFANLRQSDFPLSTVVFGLSVAVLVLGTWLLGRELIRYDWQFHRVTVAAHKPRPGVVKMAEQPLPVPAAAEPAAAQPADSTAKPSGGPAPAK